MRRSFAALVVAILAVIAAGCGSSKKSTAASTSAPATTPYGTSSSPSTTAATGTTKISSANLKGLGTVLVDAQGKTLYIFERDKAKRVTCTGGCATVWPPVMLKGAKAVAAGSVKASLLGADPDPSGGKVVTYAGWPLYTFSADSGPGTALGQAKNLNGALWYVISPSGKVITSSASSSAPTY